MSHPQACSVMVHHSHTQACICRPHLLPQDPESSLSFCQQTTGPTCPPGQGVVAGTVCAPCTGNDVSIGGQGVLCVTCPNKMKANATNSGCLREWHVLEDRDVITAIDVIRSAHYIMDAYMHTTP